MHALSRRYGLDPKTERERERQVNVKREEGRDLADEKVLMKDEVADEQINFSGCNNVSHHGSCEEFSTFPGSPILLNCVDIVLHGVGVSSFMLPDTLQSLKIQFVAFFRSFPLHGDNGPCRLRGGYDISDT